MQTNDLECGAVPVFDCRVVLLKYPDLTDKDREFGLELSVRVMQAGNWAELTQITLDALIVSKTISSATWNESTPDLQLVNCPSTVVEQEYVDSFLPAINARLELDHPVHTHLDLTDPKTLPAQRSDFASDREFRNTGLYQDAYRHLEEFHQLCCPLYVGGAGAVVLTLGRDKLSYTEREKQFVQMIRDIVSPRCSQLIHSARQQEILMGMFSAFEGNAGLVRLDARFRMKRMNVTAARIIEEYFSFNPHGQHLPGELQGFVETAWLQGGKFPGQGMSPVTRISREGMEPLHVCLLTGLENDEKLLLLKPSNGEEVFSHHQWDSLAPRELEVMHWLVRGYTQTEITDKLGIDYQTVRSTTRNVYNKLGLKENREFNLLLAFVRDFH